MREKVLKNIWRGAALTVWGFSIVSSGEFSIVTISVVPMRWWPYDFYLLNENSLYFFFFLTTHARTRLLVYFVALKCGSDPGLKCARICRQIIRQRISRVFRSIQNAFTSETNPVSNKFRSIGRRNEYGWANSLGQIKTIKILNIACSKTSKFLKNGSTILNIDTKRKITISINMWKITNSKMMIVKSKVRLIQIAQSTR